MRKYGVWALGVVAILLFGACATAYPDETGDNPVGGGPDASQPPDGSPATAPDAYVPSFPDAFSPPDAEVSGTPDAHVPNPADAAPPPPDAVPPPDAPPPPDAAPPPDAEVPSVICEAAAGEPNCDQCADAIDLTTEALGSGGATTWGDTTAYADVLEPPSTCTSGYGMDGPDAIYRVDAFAGETISVVMTPEDFDGAVYILSDCNNADTCVAGADDAVGAIAETVDYAVPANGSYYIVVDSYLSTVSGCFTLVVTLG